MAEEKSSSNAKIAEATNEKRVITIITTRGEKTKVNFDGSKWSELKSFLEKGGSDAKGKTFHGFNLSNMKCLESANRTTLEHKDARVPDGDFNLFLMQTKSKSGAKMSRSDINAQVKSHIKKNETLAKNHFGGNWTNKSSAELETLLESYEPGTKKAAGKHKAEALAQVIDSVKNNAKPNEKNTELYNEVSRMSTDDKLSLLIQLAIDIKDIVSSKSIAQSEKPVEVKKEKTQAEKDDEAREEQRKRDEEEKKRKEEEEKKADEEETKKLEKEMSDMSSGLL